MTGLVYIARDAHGRPIECALGRGELSPATASQWRARGLTWALEPYAAWVDAPTPPAQPTLFGGA